VAINCSALNRSLLENELFGHEKCSYTGAIELKHGLFEEAGNGTIFLDEIGDMPLSMQAKLLRVLQEGEFRRVGGNRVLHSSARVVLATNKNLLAQVKKGKFREDLYYRINGVQIELPPLRKRPQDIPLLARQFLK
jgi:transcriptional regulator with GAF, ATPase, and Fis domain